MNICAQALGWTDAFEVPSFFLGQPREICARVGVRGPDTEMMAQRGRGAPGVPRGVGGYSGLQLAEAPLKPLCSKGTAVGLSLPAFRTLLTGE